MTVRERTATHGEHEPIRNDETEGIHTSTQRVSHRVDLGVHWTKLGTRLHTIDDAILSIQTQGCHALRVLVIARLEGIEGVSRAAGDEVIDALTKLSGQSQLSIPWLCRLSSLDTLLRK